MTMEVSAEPVVTGRMNTDAKTEMCRVKSCDLHILHCCFKSASQDELFSDSARFSYDQ